MINDSFRGKEDVTIESEKKCCLYSMDIYMNIPSSKINHFDIEVSNFRTKNFRNEYENPKDRLRAKILK